MRAKDSSLAAKRTVDLVGAALGLVGLLVLTPFIALAIWLDSGRPIFFRQVRRGRAGLEFVMFRFRTMVQDAERETGPKWSTAGDPRITRVGRVLRRMRLDELPNLINVLRGETMDVVREYAARHPDFPMRVVTAYGANIPAAVNAGITASRSEVTVRMDSHSRPAAYLAVVSYQPERPSRPAISPPISYNGISPLWCILVPWQPRRRPFARA